MMRAGSVAVRAAAVLALTLGGGGVLAEDHLPPPDTERGHELAREVCSGCHLVDERQRGPVVDGVPSFMSIARRLDDATIEALLLAASHPVMPDPPLTAQDRRDVVAHIRRFATD